MRVVATFHMCQSVLLSRCVHKQRECEIGGIKKGQKEMDMIVAVMKLSNQKMKHSQMC